MVTKYKDRKRRRRTIDPKTLRKSSQFRSKHTDIYKPVGKRVATETGWRTEGFSNKYFETYFEEFIAGTASALFMHDKKTKHLRIMTGSGFVVTKKDDDTNTRRVSAGEEVILPHGVSYRIVTAAQDYLNMFVTQDGKYESRLQVVEECDAPATEISKNLLKEVTNEDLVAAKVTPRRGTSKAVEQQAKLERSRKVEGTRTAKVAPEPGLGAVKGSVNLRPSMGAFSKDGAG